jgi:hypothetical protein
MRGPMLGSTMAKKTTVTNKPAKQTVHAKAFLIMARDYADAANELFMIADARPKIQGCPLHQVTSARRAPACIGSGEALDQGPGAAYDLPT